jgi:hypothetical protein
VPVVLLIVGLVVLIAVVFLATGRGGELSAERTDYAPLDVGPVSATDVVLLRPPSTAWGYDMRATDEALERIAESIRERDVRIVALEQLVTDLSRGRALASAPVGGPFPNAGQGRPAAETPTRIDAPIRIDPPYRAEAPTTEHPTVVEPPAAAAAPVRERAQQPEQPEQSEQQPPPQPLPQRRQPPPERSHD